MRSSSNARIDNLVLATVSLALAVLLWLQVAVQTSATKEKEFTAQIDYKGVQTGLIAVTQTEYVKVVLQGPSNLVDQIDASAFRPYADLTNRATGSHELLLIAPELDEGVQYRMSKRTVMVQLERRIEIQKRVTVELRGIAPPGLKCDGATCQPQTVLVSGPEREVNRIQKVRAMLDLQAIQPGAAIPTTLEILGENNIPMALSHAEPDKVNVFPAVTAAPTTNTFLVIPNWQGSPPFGYHVESYTIKPSTVQMEGPSSVLAGLTSVSTEPINLSDLKQSKVITVNISVPEGAQLVTEQKVMVEVKIAKDANR